MATATKAINYLTAIETQARTRPSSIILYAVPGLGKTSFGAAIPGALFMVDRNELGIHTLKSSGLVDKDIPVLPPYDSWEGVLDTLDQLAKEKHDYKCLVLDTLGGLERLCHEHVCQRDFRGDWTDKGFTSFHKGYEIAAGDWRDLLKRLDVLRDRGMRIVGLAHAIVKPFKNPIGEDYDQYTPDMHKKTWAVSAKWADMVLFGNFHVTISKDGKGKGGQHRVMHSEYSAAFEAKNRHGLPSEISMGSSGAEAWENLTKAIKRKG